MGATDLMKVSYMYKNIIYIYIYTHTRVYFLYKFKNYLSILLGYT